jgi:hypothetical protein
LKSARAIPSDARFLSVREEGGVDDGTGEEDVDDGAEGRRDAPQLFKVAKKGGESGSVERLASGVGWRRNEKLLVKKWGEKVGRTAEKLLR